MLINLPRIVRLSDFPNPTRPGKHTHVPNRPGRHPRPGHPSRENQRRDIRDEGWFGLSPEESNLPLEDEYGIAPNSLDEGKDFSNGE